ncbi:MAG TPA: ABC transporter ATP-binding protein, partial [Candidatus Poseidoniales archaeon]|nr:ABC transporter ATP-binding protein [Candidatus Poseidoniales archaeon]
PGKLLEIEGLRVHFDTLDGPIEALHSVNLNVDQGQIMGLVGESGCGKSVTSLVTIGLATCDIDEGSVKYEGKELLFSDSESDKKIQEISGRITVVGVLASIIFVFWAILIDPIQGATFLLVFLFVSIASWLVGFAGKREYRRHQKFMRWVRGNEISMIFQEPMTALNPLYTVEKQISEVMHEHDRLVEAETPWSFRVAQALVSPLTLAFRAIRLRPQSASTILAVLAFVTVAHLNGFADDAKNWVFLLVIVIPLAASWTLFKNHNAALRSEISDTGHSTNPSISQRLLSAASILLPLLPLGIAAALVMFLMLWMPFSALLGMVVISTLLALPVIMALDYLKLDPAHTQQVISILEAVRIPNPIAVVNMYPHELSGGMRQRVMIAMMMSCEPKLLIADEPTTALDVTIQAQILQLMRDLRDEKGTAILLITHDLGVIAEMCDSVTVMYAGSIVEKGSIEDILSRPRMPYSIGLLHSIPTIDDESEHRDVLPIIPGQVPDPNLHFDGCRFHPRCPFADELCISTPPPMIEVEPGHFAACHYTNRTENVADVQGSFDVFAAEYVLKGVA